MIKIDNMEELEHNKTPFLKCVWRMHKEYLIMLTINAYIAFKHDSVVFLLTNQKKTQENGEEMVGHKIDIIQSFEMLTANNIIDNFLSYTIKSCNISVIYVHVKEKLNKYAFTCEFLGKTRKQRLLVVKGECNKFTDSEIKREFELNLYNKMLKSRYLFLENETKKFFDDEGKVKI